MYKVFINDKPLIITSLKDAEQLLEGTVQLAYHHPDDVKWAFELLNTVTRLKQVQLICDNPDEVLEEVKKKSE